MRFAWLVARRYLRSPYKPAVLRLVTLFSVVGIGAGVATLVIALSMNTGFRRTIQDRLLGVSAHVNLTRPGAEGIENYDALAEKLSHVTGVRSVAPAIYLTVLLSGGGHARGVVIKGIDPERERRFDDALRRIDSGSADFTPDSDGFESILIGHLMADELNLRAGDYVTLTSPEGRLTPYGMVPRSRRFRVAGVFNSGFFDYDANWVFARLPAAQNLAGVGDVASVLEFRVQDVDRAADAARLIGAAAGAGFITTTWEDENRALFRALRLEKLVTALFIGLITFVAGLNILVVRNVHERHRSCQGHRSADVARRPPPPSPQHFHVARFNRRRDRHLRRPRRRLRPLLGRRLVPPHPPRPASLFRPLCPVRLQRLRRHVDRRRFLRHQRSGHAHPGARRFAHFARRYPALRIISLHPLYPQ